MLGSRSTPKAATTSQPFCLGPQALYRHLPVRTKVFDLLHAHFANLADLDRGRPGMDFWSIFVLAVLKQGLGCDFDRLTYLVNDMDSVRQMLGLDDQMGNRVIFQRQTIIDNVSKLTPELLDEVNQIVVAYGHQEVGAAEELHTRADSFVVETDVHWPTDVRLLWDAIQCVVLLITQAASRHGIAGWRKYRSWLRAVHAHFVPVRMARRWRTKEDVEAYLEICQVVVKKVKSTVQALQQRSVPHPEVTRYLTHCERQLEQVERRLIHEERIPHEEKVFSVYEEHTRWICKQKAGIRAELGVPVCVIEDAHQFILHHMIQWEATDVEAAVPLLTETKKRYGAVVSCSVDRGFYSPDNLTAFEAELGLAVMPRKGKGTEASRERERAEEFVAARRQHPAIESAINNLEHRGLNRVRAHGKKGFARSVALSVVAANVHRLGLILRQRETERRARQRLAA